MRKKLAILLIISILFAIIGNSQVFADNNYSAELQIIGDKEEVLIGDTVIYEIKVSDIKAGDGVANFSMTIDYDEKVFDLKTATDDTGNWVEDEQNSKMDPKNFFVTTSDMRGTKNDQLIAKIMFTAKENANIGGNYSIKFKKIRFSAEDFSDIQIEDKEMKVTVVDGVSEKEIDDDDNVATTEASEPDDVPAPITNKNIAWDIFEVILIIVAVIMIFLTIMVYTRYKKEKKEENREE